MYPRVRCRRFDDYFITCVNSTGVLFRTRMTRTYYFRIAQSIGGYPCNY